ncbi:MAG: hypothetical protein EAZ89_15495 [Bacteroidetes bacterium]|nr:MAG: hypothetical protein EAZ89_15495 [Bacteroidota bacterium]
MKRKTSVTAEAGKQDLVITREFELPVELLFMAYSKPELLEQWMGTKVLKLVAEKRTDNSSLLTIHVVYASVAQRDQMLQLPFAQGINMAHNRLQEILNSLTPHES